MSDQQRFPEDDATPFPDETISDSAPDSDTTPVPEELTDPGKSTQTRSPSRTTRVLLGLLLLAVAAFVWFNNFRQPSDAPAVVTGTPLAPGNGLARLPDARGGTNGQPAPSSPQAPLVSGEAVGPRTAGDAPTPASDPVVPVIVLDEEGEPVLPFALTGVVARELVVSDLPFLVTEPQLEPEDEADASVEDPETGPVAQRVSINPFSPVVLAPVPEAETEFAGPTPDTVEPGMPDAVPPAGETVVDVSIPSGPDESAVTTVIRPGGERPPAAQPPTSVTPPPVVTAPAAPAPTVVAPASPPSAPATAPSDAAPIAGVPPTQAQALPRVLPGPSLSPVPDVLQERRAVEDVPQPNLAQVAVISEPGAADLAEDAEGTPLSSVSGQHSEDEPPAPLPPVATRVLPSDADPLVAGVTPLSRYLRDNDVSFTGMVLGPVSHGVFRLITQPRPVVIAIGQELPDTDIVLTDLRGQEAEFTLAGATQSLTLDLRR